MWKYTGADRPEFAAAAEPGQESVWDYPRPPRVERDDRRVEVIHRGVTIAGYLSFYPGRIECRVDGVRVEPQPGGFYGGWVTPEIVGPFKGEPGTGWW